MLFKASYKKKPNIFYLQLYDYNGYIVNYQAKTKKKQYFAQERIFLSGMNEKINKKFGIKTKFLFKKISFFESQNLDLKLKPV